MLRIDRYRKSRVMTFLSEFSEAAVDLICPPSCILCGALPEWAQDNQMDANNAEHINRVMFCNSCRKRIVIPEEEQCPRCASVRIVHGMGAEGCLECRKERKFYFEQVVALGSYDPPLSNQILLMKKDWRSLLADTFASLLLDVRGDRLRSIGADYVVPVPMYHIRRLVRNVNSAERIGLSVARFLEIPCLNNLVWRHRWTVRQATLSRDKRQSNVQNAFSLVKRKGFWGYRAPSIEGKKILIVDDVLTTGATSNEVARVLKEGGAASISVVVLARA